jgi:Zn finger protein HypA/HybF involved in hydrogenase expression
MSKRKWTDEQFIKAVRESFSYAQVLEKLNLKVAGSNYDTVKRKIKDLNLNMDHMTGQSWNTGIRYRKVQSPRPLEEILIEHSTCVNSNNLRKRLLKEGLKEYRCECCGRAEWLGKPIKLELHHINGVKDDLRIENLSVLCPNCHSFTDNYRGKNIGMSAQEETLDVEAG